MESRRFGGITDRRVSWQPCQAGSSWFLAARGIFPASTSGRAPRDIPWTEGSHTARSDSEGLKLSGSYDHRRHRPQWSELDRLIRCDLPRARLTVSVAFLPGCERLAASGAARPSRDWPPGEYSGHDQSTSMFMVIVLLTQPKLRRSCSHAASRLRISTSFSDAIRSEEHTSELQSQSNLVCRLL